MGASSSSCAVRRLSSAATRRQVHFSFVDPSGEVLYADVSAYEGETVMDAAVCADVEELEGVCGFTGACSTCHVVLDPHLHAQLPPPSEDENDMLDLAADVAETSRLGCQVRITQQFDGQRITIPSNFTNLMD
jgi:ferredoxin